MESPHTRRLSSGNHRREGWSNQSSGQSTPTSGSITPTGGGGGSSTPKRSELEFALLKQQVANLSDRLEKYIDMSETRHLNEIRKQIDRERCCSLF
jgi:hypothetical protein